MRRISSLAAAILLATAVLAAPAAHAEDFYKDKTFRFIVGYSPGGGYDTYTRLIARYFGKYVPGNPNMLVQNMTGAGSLISANYIGRRAKPDGLAGAVFNNSLIVQKALGDKKAGAVPFEKMEWAGAPSRGEIVCMIMAFTGKTTWKDVINSKEPIKIGSTRAGSTGHDIPAILNKAMGTKFKIVTGYRGTATIRLALESREVDGFCSQWESMRVTARGMLDAEGGQKLVPFVIDSHSYTRSGDPGPAAVQGRPEQGSPPALQLVGVPDGVPAHACTAAGHPQGPPGDPADGLCQDPEGPADAGRSQEGQARGHPRSRVRRSRGW